MNGHEFTLAGERLTALPSGALWWAAAGLLAVSDLHLGKSDRIARRFGTLVPPYETRETLARLDADITRMVPGTVLCLGDSFDDLAAADSLAEDDRLWLARLQAGRRWLWIEGNHDPGPVDLGGEHLAEFHDGGLTFRHIAALGATGEISGHYHPKARIAARGSGGARPCFLYDSTRAILPAYGAYTGGLSWTDPALRNLFGPRACAVLTGRACHPVPVPAGAAA
jgi:DNA ligase-associated metallophosphoesterase